MVPPVIVPPIIVPSILSLSPWARTNDEKRCNTEANTRKDVVVVFVMMVGGTVRGNRVGTLLRAGNE